MELKRYLFCTAFKGTRYQGWQTQPNKLSVQDAIEKVIRTLFSDSELSLMGSGRTDTGVHATNQYFHIDLPERFDCETLIFKMNLMLPGDIVIKSCQIVNEDFHARFSATSRSYIYYINKSKNPFLENEVYVFGKKLDLDKINEACQFLLGEQDFKSFCKSRTNNHHFRCNITKAYWVEENNGYQFHVSANRFLKGMVRALTGTLINVGLGDLEPEALPEIIKKRDRKAAGRSAPADGLYLTDVEYPGWNIKKINLEQGTGK
ncbi:tRNA pseudouridine(38-40) synthase TruA [Marinigracilibium pacificum]|uniref:tRNA pseudouridine synthase A n=1 Tax=Marinigracilibium pacificum TaxID=2729599 RepID=A0A848J5M1_9BACT|nr:tRNA pseudouridine(38-40) synthase TruA [Marinigracilibium pacificum]NMM49764.1 tRNA pseudouridine(38-40) synthase TruA [Marinigracilibium pacificum]